MIVVTLRILAPPERRDEIVHTLRALVEPTAIRRGNISCRLYQEIEDENALTLIEEWESQADVDNHIRSDDFRKILAVMDMSSEPPEIGFNRISETAGMEKVRSVREGGATRVDAA